MNQLKVWAVFVLSLLISWPQTVLASVEISKTYKETFEAKSKCLDCHVDKVPKKDDGKHDLNDYGHKIVAVQKELSKEAVDAEVLNKVGKNENAEA